MPNTRESKSDEHCHTLIEVVIALLIVGIVTTSIIGKYITGTHGTANRPLHIQSGADTRDAANEIVRLASRAEVCRIEAVDANPDTIYMLRRLAGFNDRDDVVPAEVWLSIYVDRSLSPPALMCREKGGALQIISENVGDLNLRYWLKSGDIVDARPDRHMIFDMFVTLGGTEESVADPGLGASPIDPENVFSVVLPHVEETDKSGAEQRE